MGSVYHNYVMFQDVTILNCFETQRSWQSELMRLLDSYRNR